MFKLIFIGIAGLFLSIIALVILTFAMNVVLQIIFCCFAALFLICVCVGLKKAADKIRKDFFKKRH